jgi:tetratricopeptide (TPR) repeat protein
LDPASQAAHSVLANVHFFRHELEAFFAEAERALALNPNDPGVLASLGTPLHYAGDERGIAFVRKALKLDPFHPTMGYMPIADHHFERGEYEEALAAARRVNVPDHYYAPLILAAIYAELGRPSDARSAVEELTRIWPGFTTKTLTQEWRKWNVSDERTRRIVAALRKAGLPE